MSHYYDYHSEIYQVTSASHLSLCTSRRRSTVAFITFCVGVLGACIADSIFHVRDISVVNTVVRRPSINSHLLSSPWTVPLSTKQLGDNGRLVLMPKALKQMEAFPPLPFSLATTVPTHSRPTSGDNEPEWNLLLGKVLDTLMMDYPIFLAHPIHMDIYHDEIELRDDHDLKIKGINLYGGLIKTMRLVCNLLHLQPEVTARFNAQLDTRAIRVRWNVKLSPSGRVPLFLDGVSVYKVGRDGRVYEHLLQFVTMSFNPGVRIPTIPVWQPVPSQIPRLGLVADVRDWVLQTASMESKAPEGEPEAPLLEQWPTTTSASSALGPQRRVLSPLRSLAQLFSYWLRP